MWWQQVVDMDRLDALTLRQLQSFVRAEGSAAAGSDLPGDAPAPVAWPRVLISGGAPLPTDECSFLRRREPNCRPARLDLHTLPLVSP